MTKIYKFSMHTFHLPTARVSVCVRVYLSMYQHSLDYWNQNNSQFPKHICVVGQFPLGMVEVGQQIKARQDITIYVVVFAIEKDV